MKILYFLTVIITFLSCEKDYKEEVIFSGIVIDKISNQPIKDAVVKVTQLYNLTWNSGESLYYGQYITDIQGVFTFSYTDDSNGKLFQFIISHTDYKRKHALENLPSNDSFIFELCPRQYENECY